LLRHVLVDLSQKPGIGEGPAEDHRPIQTGLVEGQNYVLAGGEPGTVLVAGGEPGIPPAVGCGLAQLGR
jgi:hypothetical protein